jgi:hypothetical protein
LGYRNLPQDCARVHSGRIDSTLSQPMPSPFSSLVSAILADNRAKVRKRLQAHPQLAADGIAPAARYETGIAHWIYAGDTLLHVAAAGYRIEIAKWLLAAGADPRAAMNHRRSQPLHYAADGHLESPSWNPDRQVAMIRLLLDAGADIHAQDKNGATPLHRAVRTRCASAVRYLLEAGADPTIWNKPGSTPFHLAAQNTGRGGSGVDRAKAAQQEIIQIFLGRKVSVDLKDQNGKSVLQWATSEPIRKMLSDGAIQRGSC